MADDSAKTAAALARLMEVQKIMFGLVRNPANPATSNIIVQNVWMLQIGPQILVTPGVNAVAVETTNANVSGGNSGKPPEERDTTTANGGW
jgi:hypothetical protein